MDVSISPASQLSPECGTEQTLACQVFPYQRTLEGTRQKTQNSNSKISLPETLISQTEPLFSYFVLLIQNFAWIPTKKGSLVAQQ